MQPREQALDHLLALAGPLLEIQQVLVALRVDGQRHHHAAVFAREHPVDHQRHHIDARQITAPELVEQLPAAHLPRLAHRALARVEQFTHAAASS